MRRKRWMWQAAIVAMVVLAACSGGDGPAGKAADAGPENGAAASDACAVLTPADIEQVLGVAAKVQPSDQLKSATAVSMCTYESADGSQNLVSVLLRLGKPGLDPETNLKQYVDGIKMNMGDTYRVDPVVGFGGPAVWNPDMKQITVFQGSTLAILTLFEAQGKQPLEAAKALAERALPRI